MRYTSSGLLSVNQVVGAYRILFAIAIAISCLFIWRAGVPVVIIGLSCALAAYAYTGGPFPLSHYGLGELLALVFFGPVAVAGTYFLHTLDFSWSVVYWGCGPGLIAGAMMAVNNHRDRETDVEAGKMTLAVLLGKRFSHWFPLTLLCLAVGILSSSRWSGQLWIYGTMMGLILGVYLFNVIAPLLSGSHLQQNQALQKISQFSLGYSILMSLVHWN